MILFLIVVGLVFVIAWAIWHFFHEELTQIVRWARILELHLVSLFYGSTATMPVSVEGVGPQRVDIWKKFMMDAPIKAIRPAEIRVSAEVAVVPLKWFFTALFGLMAFIAFWSGPATKYRRRMNLQRLMEEQAKTFKTIVPFLKFDPRQCPPRPPGQPVPAELPLFSEALSPEEWLAYNEIPVSGIRIDFARAHHALAKQLGPRWQDPQKLPLHAQGLFAAFALKHVRKRKDCEQLLNDMATCWTPDSGFAPTGKLVAQIKKVIKDPKIGGAMQKFADQHAYETTALLRCLAVARQEGGVLAPAMFLWLRGQDRVLWYPLNNLGRKSYHAEAAGAMVHYTNELIASQKIPTPRFDEIIKGLEAYLKSAMVRTIPARDAKARAPKYWKMKKKK
jgi:intracellular multiplication protein IcmP